MKKEPPTSAIVGAGVAVAGLGVSTYEGLHQASQANKIKPVDPVYNIPQEFYQNREIARQMAQIGMPQQQYNNSVNNINGTQAAALATAQNSNNPAAAVTGIVSGTNKAKANLDAEDAQARENNQRYFMDANSQVADQKLKKQQSDVFDKFTRDFNQYQALKGSSTQNINNTISGAQQLGGILLKNATPAPPGDTSRPADAIDPGTNDPSQIVQGNVTNQIIPDNYAWSVNPLNPATQWNKPVNYGGGNN